MDTTAILIEIISAIAVIIAAILSNRATQKKIHEQMKISDALQDERITKLTKEVEKHNNFAQRIPVIEKEVEVLNREMKDVKVKLDKKA